MEHSNLLHIPGPQVDTGAHRGLAGVRLFS